MQDESSGLAVTALSEPALPTLSVYAHLPWCVRKCPYCDFNSHRAPSLLPERDYVAALLEDLCDDRALVAERRVDSVFIGGGTPSLFSPESIAALIEGIGGLVELATDCEVTLEANPGTLDSGRFAEYRAAGVNRLSIGVQSFDDELLVRIGRIHTAAQSYRAVEMARKAGFERINIDLMYALPGQEVGNAKRDVLAAVGLDVEHISYYQLTIEPNTLFARQRPALPGPDESWSMHVNAERILGAAGFARYEVSAYARPGARCKHNLNYWEFGDYLGIGAGAHGKMSAGVTVRRTLKHKHPRAYLDAGCGGSFKQSECVVAPAELAFEFMLNTLRLKDGFADQLFASRTFQPLANVGQTIERAQNKGLLERSGGRIRPTALGWRFLDDLVAEFLPAQPGLANAIIDQRTIG
jgi:oxygen-independent coproporphyrinogen-3 oxidase